MGQPSSYAEAGVDVPEVKLRQKEIAKILFRTFKQREGKQGAVIQKIGHYAGLIDIGGGKALALHVDGVGTKVLVAQMINKFDTVGIDCIAMNVNDIICMGAEPIAFLDYLAIKKPDQHLIKEITLGLEEGAKRASVAVIGGETAILPELLSGGETTFDLVGMVIGTVNTDKVITGDAIRQGDSIIGVNSSGIHSNGLTLARKIMFPKYDVNDIIEPLQRSISEELLEPTHIYVKPVLKMLSKIDGISGLAHITGGAFSKLTRLIGKKKLGFNLENLPDSPPIFRLLQKEGKISLKGMFNTFNMGIGLCIITRDKDESEIAKIFKRSGLKAVKIGKITGDHGISVKGKRIA